jgi:hypothetical protein
LAKRAAWLGTLIGGIMRLEWGKGPPQYDRGIDQGVLYLDDAAVPWNGLVSVNELESGSVNTENYFDGKRLHISQETGDFAGVIEAFTYPDVFAEYNGFGDREEHRRFGFSYRTQYGDRYKIHLVYNVLVSDDARSWSTMSASLDPSLFNWQIHAAAEPVPGASPAGRLTMEVPRDPSVLASLEDILYGTETTDPRLPSPAEIVELYESATLLRITYNGDGTYTATGPDSMVRLLGDGRFELDSPTLQPAGNGKFVISSY